MTHPIHSFFQTLTTHQPYRFQHQTIAHLLQSQSVLLRAPTGSGKTETAIAPFLIAKQLKLSSFPNKLIYIVPLRTLANSLRMRTQVMIQRWETRYPPARPLVVTLQTGENPEDPRFEGDIIFCTIDQLLSSFLSIPYSVGRGSANVNAGVVFASYLVFDELHLLDPDRSFATTLQLLKQIEGLSPFLLMTATLTQELAAQIQHEVTPKQALSEVLSLVTVDDNDLNAIEGTRNRQFRAMQTPLSATEILHDIQQNARQRVIIICNTVAQSQGLYQDLEQLESNLEIKLLHSRFLPSDRKTKESQLETVFGREWQTQERDRCQVLIATQVIEAGLNITCEVLHTVLCPANALLQRAGRCARFSNESGEVRVYRTVQVGENWQDAIALETEVEPTKKPNQFLPYKTEPCDRTWAALVNHCNSEIELQSVGFAIEETWINVVHTQDDQQQLQKRAENSSRFTQDFDKAVFKGDRSVANTLIRFVDSRSVFMIEDEIMIDGDAPTVDIRQLQPFSLPCSTLCNILRRFQQAGHQDWIFKRVEAPRDKESYALPNATPITTVRALSESIRIVVNPRYADYDENVGLRIGADVIGNYRSRPKPTKPKVSQEYSYHMDTYVGHLGRMWTCWRKPFLGEMLINGQSTAVKLGSVQSEMLQAGGRFIQYRIFPTSDLNQAIALFELLVCLAVLTHDLGKLQQSWQNVMRGWQQKAHEVYQTLHPKPEFRVLDPRSHLLAHTDYQPNHTEIKQAYADFMRQHQRPPHAIESAFLSVEILETVLTPVLEQFFQATEADLFGIHHALQMATGRHHSAWTAGWRTVERGKVLQLHSQANSAIAQSWKSLRRLLSEVFPLPSELPIYPSRHDAEEFLLGEFQEDDLKYQQLYWLIVRSLRLSDARSVQM